MHRAYSTFEIKSVDDAKRLIEGIASTPSTDRVGDIVESDGAEFSLPMPFMWQHGKDPFVGLTPVGHVIAASPTKQGIPVRIQMERSDQPGRLKEILDFTWEAIQKRLVRGLSIGFSPIGTPEPIKGTFGLRFRKWNWHELSGVTIPANADASILTVKSVASALLGTDARDACSTSPSAGGTRTHKDARMTTNAAPISDQLNAASAELNTKSARLEELIFRDGVDGGLEESEQTELTSVRGDVEKLTARVKNLKALEEAQAQRARPVIVRPTSADVREIAQAPTHTVEVKSTVPVDIEFTRYLICRMVAVKAAASGLFVNPVELAKQHYPDQPRIQWALKAANDWMQKDNVPAATTTDATFAGPLVSTTLSNAFVEYLRPQTIVGRLEGMTRVDFNSRIAGQTSGATGYWVGEGQSKPLTRFAFNAQTLTWTKVAAIIALTDELARFSSPSAEARIRNEIVNALRERIDIDFIDPSSAAVAGVKPASITNGIANLNDSGATLANTNTDIAQFFNAMSLNNLSLSQCVWIMPESVALQLSLMRDSSGALAFPTISIAGGTWQGVPVITSNYLLFSHTPANNKVILVHTPSIAIADDGGFSVDVSREASLEMDDQPVMAASSAAGSPSGPTGSALVSMFQTNSIAIRAERYINWARLRNSGVVWMDDVRWAA